MDTRVDSPTTNLVMLDFIGSEFIPFQDSLEVKKL